MNNDKIGSQHGPSVPDRTVGAVGGVGQDDDGGGASEIFAVDERGSDWSVLEYHDEMKDRIATTNSSSARERRGMGTHPPLDSHLYVADPKDGAWGNPQTAPPTHAVRTFPQEHLLFQQRSEERRESNLWTCGQRGLFLTRAQSCLQSDAHVCGRVINGQTPSVCCNLALCLTVRILSSWQPPLRLINAQH